MLNTVVVKRYRKIVDQLRALGAVDGHRYGMSMLLVGEEAFCGLSFSNEMLFHLSGRSRTEALKLPGAATVTSLGGQSVEGWVRIPFASADHWPECALQAFQSVSGGEKKSEKAS